MTIGITGHQHLGEVETVAWLTEQVKAELKSGHFKKAYSCLAVGADQLFAEIIVEMNIPLVAIIPSSDYEQTFNKENRKKYKILLSKTSSVKYLNHGHSSEEAYLEAGKMVVANSNVMIAIWDGLPAQGLGGTGDVVKYAIDENKKIIHLNPLTFLVNIL